MILVRRGVGYDVFERQGALRIFGGYDNDVPLELVGLATDQKRIDSALARTLRAIHNIYVAGEHPTPLIGFDEVRA